MLRQSQAHAFYCDNPLTLLCIYNVSFKHISLLIKYSFEGRLPTLSRVNRPLPPPLSVCPQASRHLQRTGGTFFMFFTEYNLLFSMEQPVPAHLFVCTSTVFISVCVFVSCIITQGINQSSLLVICQLHFPACSNAKLFCKPLWEINTINTARFNHPKVHNIFKYLSAVFPLSSSISQLSFFPSLSTDLPLFPFQMHHSPSL